MCPPPHAGRMLPRHRHKPVGQVQAQPAQHHSAHVAELRRLQLGGNAEEGPCGGWLGIGHRVCAQALHARHHVPAGQQKVVRHQRRPCLGLRVRLKLHSMGGLQVEGQSRSKVKAVVGGEQVLTIRRTSERTAATCQKLMHHLMLSQPPHLEVQAALGAIGQQLRGRLTCAWRRGLVQHQPSRAAHKHRHAHAGAGAQAGGQGARLQRRQRPASRRRAGGRCGAAQAAAQAQPAAGSTAGLAGGSYAQRRLAGRAGGDDAWTSCRWLRIAAAAGTAAAVTEQRHHRPASGELVQGHSILASLHQNHLHDRRQGATAAALGRWCASACADAHAAAGTAAAATAAAAAAIAAAAQRSTGVQVQVEVEVEVEPALAAAVGQAGTLLGCRANIRQLVGRRALWADITQLVGGAALSLLRHRQRRAQLRMCTHPLLRRMSYDTGALCAVLPKKQPAARSHRLTPSRTSKQRSAGGGGKLVRWAQGIVAAWRNLSHSPFS